MKKAFKQFRFLPLLVVITLFSAGCSNDDNGGKSIDEHGGDVFRYQVVHIDLPNTELSQNEYDGSLGSISVEIVKIDDHKLAFAVPIDAPLGDTELVIPGLNNAKIRYNVLQPELEQSVDETIIPLISLSETYFSGLEEPGAEEVVIQNEFQQFKNYLEQNATTEEKEQLALYYQLNKEAIDAVLLYDGSNMAERLSEQDIYLIGKFLLATTVTVGGGFIVVYEPSGILKILGLVITKIGFNKARVFHNQFAERNVYFEEIKIGGITGENERGVQSDEIVLQDDATSTLSFQAGVRRLLQSDSGIANSTIVNFFNGQSSYNYFIDKVNGAIAWVNSNIPLVSFSTLSHAALTTNSSITNVGITSGIMQDISFSVNHPNLQLVTASLSGEGQLKLKVKVEGNPTTTPVVSTLNYSYSDKISSFSGSFPIKVESEFSLVGNWTVAEVDNNPTNEWLIYDYDCPGQREDEFMTGQANFTNTSFSINIQIQYNYFLYGEGCSVIQNSLSDGYLNYNGTYSYENESISVTEASGQNEESGWIPTNSYFEIVDENTIICRFAEEDEYEDWITKIVLVRQ